MLYVLRRYFLLVLNRSVASKVAADIYTPLVRPGAPSQEKSLCRVVRSLMSSFHVGDVFFATPHVHVVMPPEQYMYVYVF